MLRKKKKRKKNARLKKKKKKTRTVQGQCGRALLPRHEVHIRRVRAAKRVWLAAIETILRRYFSLLFFIFFPILISFRRIARICSTFFYCFSPRSSSGAYVEIRRHLRRPRRAVRRQTARPTDATRPVCRNPHNRTLRVRVVSGYVCSTLLRLRSLGRHYVRRYCHQNEVEYANRSVDTGR